MKGQLAIVCWDFFLLPGQTAMSNWSPSSKHAVSEGAPKPNLAKIKVKLVLLKYY